MIALVLMWDASISVANQGCRFSNLLRTKWSMDEAMQ